MVALLLSFGHAALGCEGSPDANDVLAKHTALNARTCACKDVECVKAGEQEFSALQPTIAKVKKDEATLSKFAELRNAHYTCVKTAMASLGFN